MSRSLSRWIAKDVLGADEQTAAHAETAGRLCKADLATDMVREMTELQGTMGGIYAREDGQPEAVWKAIYYHYLPGRCRSRRAADEGAARRGGHDLGGRVDGRQARHGGRACLPPASGRPDRAIRTVCAAQRRVSCALSIDLPELTGVDKAVRWAARGDA